MLECLSFKSLTLTSAASASVTNLPPPPAPHSQGAGNSTDGTPATSTRSSPTPTVSGEYDLAVQANSYNEIRSMIQNPSHDDLYHLDPDDDDSRHRQVLAQVLQPDRESIREALARCHPHAPLTALTRLVSTYFDHSENTCDLCLLLHRSVHRARRIYAPLSDLIAVLPDNSGSLNQHHCNRAYDIFVEFDRQENPFIFPNPHRSFSNIRSSFSELRQKIENRRRNCQSRINLIRRATTGCAMCFIVTAVGMVVSTVVATTHAVAGFALIAAAPFSSKQCIPHPKKSVRKEVAKLKQLDAAAKSTYVVKDLDTIDSLVDRLQTAVEGDKNLVRFAVGRGRERHPIQEVLKEISKNQQSFQKLLEDLEEHIFLFFNTINKARLSLLQEICLHQT